ncbi:alpha/beta hydrolase [Neobacillus dielmonensis]|uniref:alpha/beta hydrolase n=1 Tax=Neobacillus dielmonensis TaxID=1347369 RepID=UPI0005A66A83|nr:alpha/beta hydrolase-fold protein [Neobacillus dielmonensis]
MLEEFFIYMKALEQDRQITVYLPETYQTGDKHYPVLYMHDGQNVFEDASAINGVSLGMKQYLDKTCMDIVVVAINQNSEERINEYCPWGHGPLSREILGFDCPLGGKGEAYLEFIVHELKPFIDKKYRTIPAETAMAGISLGALISTYAACRYPTIFKKIAALSPAYYRNQEAIEKLLNGSELSSVEKFYMDIGTREVPDNVSESELFVDLSKRVYEIVSSKIGNSQFTEIINAEHHYRFFRERIPAMLAYLFSE